MTALAPERHFATFSRGQQREDILASFRYGLRQLVNPETGEPFSEPEIATATAQLSRWWSEADAIDLVLLAGQQRALWLADQIDPRTASTSFLENYHAALRDLPKLAATGGSGLVAAPATVGATFVGSTTVPDATATYGTDPKGLRFQVLFTVVATADGLGLGVPGAQLTLKGIDTGEQTNLAPGTQLKWANGPLGATEPASVTAQFTGGLNLETDAQQAKRVVDDIRHKQAAGNRAHIRAWAREASNAVEDACVYPCAYHAGSTHVALLQKRGNVAGPLGRIASPGTLASVISYLVPPGSPVVPTPPHVVITGCNPIASNMVLSLALPRGVSSGWADLQPWPFSVTGLPTTITQVTDTMHFQVTIPVGSAALPSGVTAPSLMIWNDALSRFEKLNVLSVTLSAGQIYDVVLSGPSSKTLIVGDYIAPYASRLGLIGETVEAYFDSLGPGELVNLSSDSRAHRAFRFPEPSETLPQRAGSSVTSYLQDALGASLSDATLDAISVSTPPLPTDMILGPSLLVAGRVGVYPLL